MDPRSPGTSSGKTEPPLSRGTSRGTSRAHGSPPPGSHTHEVSCAAWGSLPVGADACTAEPALSARAGGHRVPSAHCVSARPWASPASGPPTGQSGLPRAPGRPELVLGHRVAPTVPRPSQGKPMPASHLYGGKLSHGTGQRKQPSEAASGRWGGGEVGLQGCRALLLRLFPRLGVDGCGPGEHTEDSLPSA